ncbi:MAG TPA: hypothetical protein VEA39_00860 [Methylophilaceae bacterium]|nr:hypothetical protein [Methylophilaceae bacterium]
MIAKLKAWWMQTFICKHKVAGETAYSFTDEIYIWSENYWIRTYTCQVCGREHLTTKPMSMEEEKAETVRLHRWIASMLGNEPATK